MNNDQHNHSDQFDAALPLPIDDDQHKSSPQEQAGKIDHSHKDLNPAADIIRRRIEAAYQAEPSAGAESKDLKKLEGEIKPSRHQQFIIELTSSGRPLHEIQIAWHEYYAALSDKQKHEVWQEFYATHARASNFASGVASRAPDQQEVPIISHNTRTLAKPTRSDIGRRLYNARQRIVEALPSEPKLPPTSPLRSLLFGFGVGAVVMIIFLFSFFNERFIAPFIQPSRTVSATPIISSAAVGNAAEVIIPKINVQIPVIYDVGTIDEAAIDKGLERGVVHYVDTALPGQNGNVVIVGHSSNNIFNPGRYKFAFVLLSRLENGDTFYLQKDGKRYTYQIYKKQIVSPTDVSVLGPAEKPATATLITCDPPGTTINRLVVTAEQIDPAPATNSTAPAVQQPASRTIPGNAPSLWSRFVKWFSE